MLSMENIAHSERPFDQIGCRERLCAYNVEYGAVARGDASRSHDTRPKIGSPVRALQRAARADRSQNLWAFRDDASVPSPPGKGFEASSAAIMHDALQVVPEPQSGTLGLAPALHGVGQLNDPAEMNACP